LFDGKAIRASQQLIVEYDSYYWHKSADALTQDKRKTKVLEEAGWTVLRVREEPLPKIGSLDIQVRKGQFKRRAIERCYGSKKCSV